MRQRIEGTGFIEIEGVGIVDSKNKINMNILCPDLFYIYTKTKCYIFPSSQLKVIFNKTTKRVDYFLTTNMRKIRLTELPEEMIRFFNLTFPKINVLKIYFGLTSNEENLKKFTSKKVI